MVSVQQGSDKVRKYYLKLDAYGISKAAYGELYNFCLQYDEKLARLNDAYSLKSPNLSGMPHGSGISDPTAKAAELCGKYRADIELIEKTAKEVDEEIAPFLIKNVTSDTPLWVLKTTYGMKTGERQFKLKRRQFFYLLAVKKQII